MTHFRSYCRFYAFIILLSISNLLAFFLIEFGFDFNILFSSRIKLSEYLLRNE